MSDADDPPAAHAKSSSADVPEASLDVNAMTNARIAQRYARIATR